MKKGAIIIGGTSGIGLATARYLKKCGYQVSFNLYNSANFGTPQIRERVVIVGNKKENYSYSY